MILKVDGRWRPRRERQKLLSHQFVIRAHVFQPKSNAALQTGLNSISCTPYTPSKEHPKVDVLFTSEHNVKTSSRDQPQKKFSSIANKALNYASIDSVDVDLL